MYNYLFYLFLLDRVAFLVATGRVAATVGVDDLEFSPFFLVATLGVEDFFLVPTDRVAGLMFFFFYGPPCCHGVKEIL